MFCLASYAARHSDSSFRLRALMTLDEGRSCILLFVFSLGEFVDRRVYSVSACVVGVIYAAGGQTMCSTLATAVTVGERGVCLVSASGM